MPGLFLRALHILIHLILRATCEVGLSSPLSANAADALNNGPSQEEAQVSSFRNVASSICMGKHEVPVTLFCFYFWIITASRKHRSMPRKQTGNGLVESALVFHHSILFDSHVTGKEDINT